MRAVIAGVFATGLLLLLLYPLPAQLNGSKRAVPYYVPAAVKEKLPQPDPLFLRLRQKLNPESDPWSADMVYKLAAEHLSRINEVDRCRIRYFDMSSTPKEVLDACIAALLFGTNSTALVPDVHKPRPVENSDNRIFWIDLAWYNWTPEAWDKIANEDPYFRVPIVDGQSPAYKYLLKYTQTNAIIRADWWLYYTFDTTQFLAKGEVKAKEAFYYTLVFSGTTFERKVKVNGKDVVKKVSGVAPETAAEFRFAFGVDTEILRRFAVDIGAVIDEGYSGVSYGNRVLWRIAAPTGVYWRTFDVFRSAGDQDFIEHPFPNEFDAGEHIFQDARGAQFYLLTDGKDQRVEFGDPRLVHDHASGSGPDIVITGKSCIACHDTGILTYRNEIPKIIASGVQRKDYEYDRAARYRQFFLQTKQAEELVRRDQENYTRFVFRCNGLTPTENIRQFLQIRTWYAKHVTLSQAAFELGTTEATLRVALSIGVRSRLGRLALTGQPIPRVTWERGAYQEAALLLRLYQRHKAYEGMSLDRVREVIREELQNLKQELKTDDSSS